MTNIQQLRYNIEQRKGERNKLITLIGETEREKIGLKRAISQHERALEIVKIVGLQTQKELEYCLAEQVSLALAAVFDDPYELKVEFEEKRGKTEANLLFERRQFKGRPIGSVGGGTIGVGAFSLRVAYLSMRQDKRMRPVLILDEPFHGLKGQEANLRALKLLNTISHKLGIQIITISDERIPREDIIANADRVFLVQMKKGISQVQILKAEYNIKRKGE